MTQLSGTVPNIMLSIFQKKIFKFFVVAFLATFLNYLIFYFLLEALNVDYRISSATGIISGVFLGYYLNSKWTFQKSKKSKSKIVKYYAVYLTSLLISIYCLQLFVSKAGMDARIGNILCICSTFCTNYIGTRFWVFKEKTQ